MENVKDEFQGFGEEFDCFPKRLPDDCVEYAIYIIDSKLKSHKDLISRLETIRKGSVKLTNNLLTEYIWQRDEFQLRLETGKGMMHLYGRTNYGDSVEDEWLIVYLLKELSKTFPDIWVKVGDSDGEFLLIEAANALPRWLNPEIADNRVWVHNDKLRIIPLSASTESKTKTAPISRSLTLEEAIETIVSTPDILINSPLIESESFYRLRNYPAQIVDSLHYAPITIPRKLAYILHDRPAAIAPAVEAFYLRDPIAIKPLQSTSSKLLFPPEDLVTVSTRFTKVLYAQLKSQQFSTPPVWRELIPQTDGDEKELPMESKQVMLHMGMKVTSGFEMLISDPKNADYRTVRESKIILEDLSAGNDDLPTDVDIKSWKDVDREDDEKWLDINFDDFDRELKGNGQEKSAGAPGTFGPEPPSGFGDAKTQADLKKMVERFESFLNDDAAGIDGAEMDDMDIDNDDEEYSEDDSEDEDKDVSFDEKEFSKMMREMMGLPSEDGDEMENRPSRAGIPQSRKGGTIEEVDSDEENEEDEAEELRIVMQRMEAELNDAGALALDPTPKELSALKGKGKTDEKEIVPKEDWEDESDDENANIDFTLAKNLLESFKSQAGLAGPGGNMMGMMGMQLPRDEEGMSKKK